jgi:hypothetical protein
MRSCLQLVTEQFPYLRDRVVRVFERDLVFQELCEDYEACAQALERQSCNQALQHEYTALRLRLETELLRYVEDVKEPGNGGS